MKEKMNNNKLTVSVEKAYLMYKHKVETPEEVRFLLDFSEPLFNLKIFYVNKKTFILNDDTSCQSDFVAFEAAYKDLGFFAKLYGRLCSKEYFLAGKEMREQFLA